jgi:hypothetical protein
MGGHATCAAITDAEHQTWTVHTTVDDEKLLAQFKSENSAAQGVMTGPTGEQICFLSSYPTECVAGVAGLYRIDVYLSYGEGTASYSIGIDSRTRPAHCTTLDPAFFAADAAPLTGSLPAGSAGDCYRFDGHAGQVLQPVLSGSGTESGTYADVRGTVFNAAGESSCDLYYGGECPLAGDGPYTFFLTEQYATAATYSLRLTRLDHPTGCAPLAEGAFGPLSAAQLGQGKLGEGEFGCYAVTASAGRHLVQVSNNGDLTWNLRDPAGAIVCQRYDIPGNCELPAAGDYSLWVRNQGWGDPLAYQTALIDLTTTTGCETAVGGGWNTPATTFTQTSDLEAFCQPITARPGDRVVAYSSALNWLTDATGARICDNLDGSSGGEEQDGCVLPGAGPYRLILLPGTTSGDGTFTAQVGRLSAPVGCPTIKPGAYGAAPAGALGGIRCRTLSVPTAGDYRIRAVDEENYDRWGRIYTADGKRLCTTGGSCEFPAAGDYTLVIGGDNPGVVESAYATAFVATAAAGCVTASDQGASGLQQPVRGVFDTAGQTDCVLLPTAAGSKVGLLVPPRATGTADPDQVVINAAGDYLCDDYALGDGTCALTGNGPFRIILTAPEEHPSGGYTVAVQRSGGITGCPTLNQSAIGSTPGLNVTFGATKFTTCLAIPAAQHSAYEILSFAQATASTGWAKATVYDSAGTLTCSATGAARFFSCKFVAGEAYTMVLVADPVTSTYRIARRDASPAGVKCQTPTSTTLGGKASAGTLAGVDDIRCYRITGTAATAFWVGARSADISAHYWITNAAGAEMSCMNTASPCRVTGSASYQVFVWGSGGSVPYQLDTWNLGVAGQPPAQCPSVVGTTGFGPVTGTLTNDRTAVCVAVPVDSYDDYTVALTNTAGGDAEPMPFMINAAGTTGGIFGCSLTQGGHGCMASVPYPARSGVALFLVTPGLEIGTFPFRAQASCDEAPCDTAPYSLTSVSPASASNNTTARLTLRGTSLYTRDVVRLSRSGSATITAVVRGVSGDRSTLTADANLLGAAPGAWNVSVTAYSGGTRSATRAGALTVTAAPVRATRAPALSGPVRVGATVRAVPGTWAPTATSYAYQWLANGVAIRGAVGPAYVVPATLRGKKLSVRVAGRRSNLVATTSTSATATVGYGVAARATKAPAITGTVKRGKTVKAAVGTWSPKAGWYAYEWRLNGKLIRGATTSSLKLTTAMAGRKLTVTVIAKRSGCYDGRSTSTSVTVKR